ncbi:heavy metal translocating P-type ATPase [Primorskyibacter sp. S87]|uniref:heavy metal translocating P-type ATPase n=1 Tax=Primorskyibacter sp. S87 TaxID=3415126 RepID=UPI003C7DA669
MGVPGTTKLQITGMGCASCVGRVEKALAAVSGVETAEVNFATRSAEIVHDRTTLLTDLSAALDEAGYPAALLETEFTVEGLNCASCVRRAETALVAAHGVVEGTVNLATKTAHVRYARGATTPQEIGEALTASGYPAHPRGTVKDDSADDHEINDLAHATLIAALLALPVFVLEMGGHMIPAFHHWVQANIGDQTSKLVQFALTTAILLGPGRIFLAKGLPALRRGAPDMNSLVALGTSAAYAYSVIATFFPSLLPAGTANVYFEAAAVIVVLILLGRLLEARAKGRTGAAIRALVGLQPQTAQVEKGKEVLDLPLGEIAQGDVLRLRPGERIAVDGVVLEGRSHVDESMITGEPIPVAKGKGDQLIAGTVNGTGAMRLRATEVGAGTVLARIIRMVEQAQGSKLPIQALVDRVAAVFVPAVMGIAALTVLVWMVFGPDPALSMALVAGVSVLIIACPCAMGLATPTSIMVGTGRAAELGVLFRKGDALQALQSVKVVAFDKTGTLTLGEPTLTDLLPAEGVDADSVLRFAAAAEVSSEHPIARAITAAYHGDLPLAEDVEAVTGMGLQARVEGHDVLIGAKRLMRAHHIDPGTLATQAERLGAAGKSPLFVAIDGQIEAVIAVSDPIKPGAPEAIAALKAQGFQVAMITGDAKGAANAIAAQLGIDHVTAEVLPGGKVEALDALRSEHGNLAFVGDGINDAPALASADVGIAIGTGTDVAIEAADVVLISGDLQAVLRGFAISRQTMRNIKQNLVWAFGYNILLIPVAAGILVPFGGPLLSPALAAGAMALSSVFVVTNALRLRWVGQQPEPTGPEPPLAAAPAE